MSLINEMLRNLEAKRPDDLARQNLQREIRTLPALSPPRRGLRWLVLLLVLVSISLSAYWLQQSGELLLPWLAAQERSAPIVAVSAIQPEAVPALPNVAADIQPETVSDSLPMANDLTVPPMPAVPMLAVPDPVVPPVTDGIKAEVDMVKPAPAIFAGPVKIEKSVVLATPRDRADAEYRKAENAMSAGRSGEAMTSLYAALKQDPTHAQVRQSLLRQLLGQQKLEEAMTVLHEGLEIQPAQVGWAMSLARLQLERGDIAAADSTLARSQGYAEANADYAGFQGHLKSRLGEHRQAAVHYLRATRLSPAEGRWWFGLGVALEADERIADGKAALRQALATTTLSSELAALAEQHLR